MTDRPTRPLMPQTRRNYRTKLERCIRLAAEANRSILADDVQTVRFVLGRVSPHPGTRNGYLDALRCFYDFLIAQGLRKDNPARDIGRSRIARGRPRPFSIDECCRYLDAARELGAKHYTIAVLALHMGMRREEMRILEWVQFFEAEGRMWLDVTGKGGSFERVPVHPAVREALRILRAGAESTHLFASPVLWGKPVSRSWMHVRHHEILDAAGLTDGTLHQLRHSYATYLGRSGADISVVQRGLRHASISSTQIYREVLPEELAEWNERLDYRQLLEERIAKETGT